MTDMGIWEFCQGENAGNPKEAENGHDEEDPTRDDRRVDHPSVQLSNLSTNNHPQISFSHMPF